MWGGRVRAYSVYTWDDLGFFACSLFGYLGGRAGRNLCRCDTRIVSVIREFGRICVVFGVFGVVYMCLDGLARLVSS